MTWYPQATWASPAARPGAAPEAVPTPADPPLFPELETFGLELEELQMSWVERMIYDIVAAELAEAEFLAVTKAIEGLCVL